MSNCQSNLLFIWFPFKIIRKFERENTFRCLTLPPQVGLVVPGTADAQRLCAADVDQRIEALGELQVVPFELLLVVLLIGCDEILVFLEGVAASVGGKRLLVDCRKL
jgi:hypothetical protein